LVLSDYCVGGVDNHTKIIIDSFVPRNCTSDTLKYYLFCNWLNDYCDPFPAFLNQIQNITADLQQKINNDSTNPEVKYWNDTINILKNAKNSLDTLSVCNETQRSYVRTTNSLCFDATSSQIYLTSIFQLLTGLLFIYIMITMYTWNRIAVSSKKVEYEVLGKQDIKSGKRKNPIVTMKSRTPGCDMSIGCLSFLIINLIVVLGLLFAVVFVFLFGSQNTMIPR